MVHTIFFRFRKAMFPLAAACLVASCGSGDLALPGDGEATAIRVVAGDGQVGSVGEPLGAPLVVEVTDASGAPVEGVSVEFVLTSAGQGAGVAPATASTGSQGRAQTEVLLGDKVGLQTGEARIVRQAAAPVTATFAAVALADDNQAPDADFDWQCDGLACRFSDASTDDDGSVTGWTWRFGDGGTSTERAPSHRYESAGTYTVTLDVIDDRGSQDESSEQVTVTFAAPPPEPNDPPQAEFEVDCQELRCVFVDRSGDGDGSVVNWRWDFGDGATSAERNPSHSYVAAGRYEVLLVATDDDGAADSRTHTAEPDSPEANKPPRAEFEVQCSGLVCSFTDKSEDEDGVVVSWQWSFGDGDTSTERDPVHTYAERRRFDVLLTVTDDDGASATKTHRAEPKK